VPAKKQARACNKTSMCLQQNKHLTAAKQECACNKTRNVPATKQGVISMKLLIMFKEHH
jgi:hypothetical protein